MKTIYLNNLGRYRGAILGWGLILAVLGAYLVAFYDTLAAQQQQFQQLLDSYPPELLAFFGGTEDIFTPSGYLSIEFFAIQPLVLGIFAVLAGSSLLAADEENGTLDLILAYPISRTTYFIARTLSLVTAILTILAVIYFGLWVGVQGSMMDLSWLELAGPFISLAVQLFLFAALGLLLSQLLPSRRVAAMASGLILVASYFLTSLARLDERLEPAARLSPLSYYQSGEAILGVHWEWVGGLVLASTACALLSWRLFLRKDLRVGGEGSWQLPPFPRLVRRSQRFG